MRYCDKCEYYLSGELCGHPSIIEPDMGGKGDTFPWIDETPSWCSLKDEPQMKTSTNSEKVQLTDEPQTEEHQIPEYEPWRDAFDAMDCQSKEVQDDHRDDID